MIEDKAHTFEVALAYAGTLGALVVLILVTFLQARRARVALKSVEGDDA